MLPAGQEVTGPAQPNVLHMLQAFQFMEGLDAARGRHMTTLN